MLRRSLVAAAFLFVASTAQAKFLTPTVTWAAGTFPATETFSITIDWWDVGLNEWRTQNFNFNLSPSAGSKQLNLWVLNDGQTHVTFAIYPVEYNWGIDTGEEEEEVPQLKGLMFEWGFKFCKFITKQYNGVNGTSGTVQFPAITETHNAWYVPRYVTFFRESQWLSKDGADPANGSGPESCVLEAQFVTSRGDAFVSKQVVASSGWDYIGTPKWVLFEGDTWHVVISWLGQYTYEDAPTWGRYKYYTSSLTGFTTDEYDGYNDSNTFDDIRLTDAWCDNEYKGWIPY